MLLNTGFKQLLVDYVRFWMAASSKLFAKLIQDVMTYAFALCNRHPIRLTIFVHVLCDD